MLPPGSSKQSVSGGENSVSGFATFGSIRPSLSAEGKGDSVPELTLANDSLNIRIVAMNGAIIGRRKGPYTQFFENQAYVSGVHAQLKYNSRTGWSITDKHSSNGTRLNKRQIQPDVDITLSNGDVLTIANINLQVNIR